MLPGPFSREAALTTSQALQPGGASSPGSAAGQGFDDFMAMATDAGLEPENVFSTWDLRPFEEDSDFLVAVFYQARSA